MSSNVIAALSIIPILLAAGVDFLYSGLRPMRTWLLKTHIGVALLVVPLTIGVLVPAFDRLTATGEGTALLTAGELVVTYGVLVVIWTLRTALESASPSLFRR